MSTLESPANPAVADKYRTAGRLVDEALAKAVDLCVVDSLPSSICESIDQFLMETLQALPGKKVIRVIAVPTTVNVNHRMGFVAPLKGDLLDVPLKQGDLVKIDCGISVDGYIVHAGVSSVLASEANAGAPTEQDRIVAACRDCLEAAVAAMTVGSTNEAVTLAIEQAAIRASERSGIHVTPVLSVVSHKLQRFIMDSNDCIANRNTTEQAVPLVTFTGDDVYALDVMVSTSEAAVPSYVPDCKATLFKRNLEVPIKLVRLEKARDFITTVDKDIPTSLFHQRLLTSDPRGRLAFSEIQKHSLLTAYPPLTDEPGSFVASFKSTVSISPQGVRCYAGFGGKK